MHKRVISATILSAIAIATANDLNNGGNRGLLRTTSALTSGAGMFNIGVGGKFGVDTTFANGIGGTYVLRKKDGVQLKSTEKNVLFSTNIYAGIGAGKATDISVNIPYYYDIAEWGPKGGGLGDLEVAVKVNPFSQEKRFALAFGAKAILPTGIRDNGYFARHAYSFNQTPNTTTNYTTTGGEVLFEPELFLTADLNRLQLHLNLGDVVNIKEQGSTITSAAGLEFLLTEQFNIFTEVTGETRSQWISGDYENPTTDNDVMYWSTGTRYQFDNGIYLLGAFDMGISDDVYNRGAQTAFGYEQKGTPKWGGNFAIGWSGPLKGKDSDNDSIVDKLDNCPNEAEDYDGFKDTDGCPDFDNDNDGIADASDKSPNEAEDKDGFQDEDGTPDLDNDNDGITDLLDKCPNEAEDKDGFKDEDGCPDLDNDNDGITDLLDKCPGATEDNDGFKDGDGCPENDNDEDGIADLEDKCPNAKGLAKDNGCPVVKEISRDGLLLSGVTFELNKAVLAESSSKTLDEVANSLIAWIEVKVEIQGHTDSTGSAEKNLTMSQERADAVKNYLYNKGVAEDRMVAKGYGKDVPVADNKTAEGRAQNRRVELKRID